MKRLLVLICSFLYRLKSPVVRRCLRAIIARMEGGQAFSLTLRKLAQDYHGVSIGIGTYGPCFSPEQTWTGKGNLFVGKFTSIANGVCIYSRNHPYWYASTCPLFYNASFSKNILSADAVSFGKLEIGNDVWIGQYAVILPSCHRIGDGAVIGAGSIVTADVPDYAIVAGNPARVLKYRFDEETISKLKAIKWWDWELAFIRENAGAFESPEMVIELFGKKKLFCKKFQ